MSYSSDSLISRFFCDKPAAMWLCHIFKGICFKFSRPAIYRQADPLNALRPEPLTCGLVTDIQDLHFNVAFKMVFIMQWFKTVMLTP